MKYILIIISILGFSANVFSETCDEKAKARMIKAGISDKVIEEQCNIKKEGVNNDENEKDSETVITNNENVNKTKRWRFGAGTGTGKFKYNDTSVSALNGKFDHDLSGSSFVLNYFVTDDDNYIYGGGFSTIDVSGPLTQSIDKVQGYWTYYHPTYGYFDITVQVNSYRSTFFYGIFGYDYKINDKYSFQPSIRYGLKFLVAEWTENIDWNSYNDQIIEYSEAKQNFGLDIILPLNYSINKDFSFGVDFCICGSNMTLVSGTSEYEYSNFNAFNLFFDYHL